MHSMIRGTGDETITQAMTMTMTKAEHTRPSKPGHAPRLPASREAPRTGVPDSGSDARRSSQSSSTTAGAHDRPDSTSSRSSGSSRAGDAAREGLPTKPAPTASSDAGPSAGRSTDPVTRFDRMGLKRDLLAGVFAYGYDGPTAIQERAIVPLARGDDVIAQAQSGTGKTGAFCIGMLQRIDTSKAAPASPQGLMLAPVRELADQTHHVLSALGERLDVKTCLCMGGVPEREDAARLRGRCHVVVGTPGRVLDLVRRGILDLSRLQVVVLDEADELLDHGFQETLEEIFALGIPKAAQVAMFSATLPEEAYRLARDIMRPDPTVVLVKAEELTLDGIDQFQVQLDAEDQKLDTLVELYERVSVTKAIIFCNLRRKVEWLADEMRARDFAVSHTHADMTMAERMAVMQEFRSGASRVLISSDLLGRGIDVQQVSLAINFDVPNKRESYIHRVGRTGRHGRKGFALTMVTPDDAPLVRDIETHYHTELEVLPMDVEGALGGGGRFGDSAAVARAGGGGGGGVRSSSDR